MRFTTLAAIDIIALVISSAIGIAMAAAGYGYWSLVGSSIDPPAVATCDVARYGVDSRKARRTSE